MTERIKPGDTSSRRVSLTNEGKSQTITVNLSSLGLKPNTQPYVVIHYEADKITIFKDRRQFFEN